MSIQDQMKRGASVVAVLMHRVFGERQQDRLGMLLHHRVSPSFPGLPDPPHNVTPDVFREQLVGLLAAGYRFVKLKDVLEARRMGKPLPPRSVVLTFDDIYESVYRHAFPVMKELRVPGVAFVSTSFLDSQEPFPFDEWSLKYRPQLAPEDYRPVTTDQCREMLASELFEFGAHTHTHTDLRGRPDVFCSDVSQSAAIVRELFQLEDVAFAFPWGSTANGNAGGELTTAARKAGVCCALTTDGELIDLSTDDEFNWGRFVVFSWDTPATLAAKLSGWYAWARNLKQYLGRRPLPSPAHS